MRRGRWRKGEKKRRRVGLTEEREREGKKGVDKGGIGMKWEENWSSGRKVEREGKGEEARKMERKKKRGRVGLMEKREGG